MEFSQNVRLTLNSLRYILSFCVNILIFALVAYGIGQICVSGYHFCYEIFGSVVVEEAPGTDREFVVQHGRDMRLVAKQLEQEGLIVDRYSFYIRTQLMDTDDVILRPGTYILNTSMDYEEIIDQLTTNE
ncbi:MAG: endolytic transglycosylase MltG [Lachnospiraceae bacterium]|nr:endolytic transglycosylase MltG [Lachnospiraceae bacterium]